MMLISMIVMNKKPSDLDEKQLLINFLLALAISFKPIAIIFLPYFIFKSSKPYLPILYCFIYMHLFNLFYILDFGYDSFLTINSYVLNKIASGHQLSHLALGSFSQYIPFTYLKLITILGIIFTLILALEVIRNNPFVYCATIFMAVLVLRYNAHPQYFLWPLPFLFIISPAVTAWSYSLICTIAISLNLTIWPANGGAFSFINVFESLRQLPFNEDFSIYYQDSFLRFFIQILLIMLLLYLLKFERIISAFKRVYLYLIVIAKRIEYKNLIFHLTPIIFLLFMCLNYYANEDFLFLLKYITISFAPIILSSIFKSCGLFNKNLKSFYLFYITIIFLKSIFLIFDYGSDSFLWIGVFFYLYLILLLRSLIDELDKRIKTTWYIS